MVLDLFRLRFTNDSHPIGEVPMCAIAMFPAEKRIRPAMNATTSIIQFTTSAAKGVSRG
jgi:hypothetical protein